jgi:hypothetical protein
MSYKYLIIFPFIFLTFGCKHNEQPSNIGSQVESALRQLVEKYPDYKINSDIPLKKYYSPSIIYNLKNSGKVQLQYLTPPQNDKIHDDIILIIDSVRCFGIPFFSNKYDDYWQFAESNHNNYKRTFEYEVKSMLENLSVPDSMKGSIAISLFDICGFRQLYLLDTNILQKYSWCADTPKGKEMVSYDITRKKTEKIEDCEFRLNSICLRIISSIKQRYSEGLDFRYLFLLGNGKILEVSMNNAFTNTGKFEIKIVANRLDCRMPSGPL